MAETENVKVRCFPIRSYYNSWQHPDPAHRPTWATSALPFVWSRNGRYTHRVRAVTVYPHGRSGFGVHAWCGMLVGSAASPSKLSATIDPDRPLCGTCHGRAVGAGQIDTDGVPLIFTPLSGEPNLGQCIWLKPGYGPYGYPSRCHRTAIERIPEAPDVHKAGVCAEHARKWPPSAAWRYEESLRHGGLEPAEPIVRPARKIEGPAFLPAVEDLFLDLGWDPDDLDITRREPDE